MGAFNLATHYLDRHVEEGRGGRTALLTPEGPVSYAELAARTNRIGNLLLSVGVQRGDRGLLALSDGVDFVASWYAAIKIGAVIAEVYTFLPAKDYAYYLGYAEPAAVVVDEITIERMREGAATAGFRGRLLVAGEAADAPATLAPAPTTRDDPAIWKFTTGSTGAPKAAVHRMGTPALSSRRYGHEVLGLREDDVVVPVPKLFFGYARDLTTLFPFEVGGCGVVFPERTTPERIFDLVERHRATVLVTVPTMMRAMLDHPQRDVSSLRFCTSSGEALPAELHRRWLATFGVEVLEGIGSSEAYHVYISNRPGAARPGSAGQLVPGYRARMLEPAGELVVEGGTVATMYWGDPEKSRATFDGDAVRTGDLAERDDDGFFRFRGRIDDLLKVGGIWVAPVEIEDCLATHPDVAGCAVIGAKAGGLTITRAFVVLRAGCPAGPETARALRDHVRAELSPHKCPREVRFVDALPTTASGKVDRRALREAG